MKHCSAGFAVGVLATVLVLLIVCLGAGYGLAGGYLIYFEGSSRVFQGLRLQGTLENPADGYRFTFDQQYGEGRRAAFQYVVEASEPILDEGDPAGDASRRPDLSYHITVPSDVVVHAQWEEDPQYIYVDEQGHFSEDAAAGERTKIGYTLCQSVDRATVQLLLRRNGILCPVGEPLSLTDRYGELVFRQTRHYTKDESGRTVDREGESFLTVDGRPAYPAEDGQRYIWITGEDSTLYVCTAYSGRVFPGSGIYRLQLADERAIPDAVIRLDVTEPEAFVAFAAHEQHAVLVTAKGVRVADMESERLSAPMAFPGDVQSCNIVFSNGAACLRSGSAFLAVDLQDGTRLAGGELADMSREMPQFDALIDDGRLYTLEYATTYGKTERRVSGTAPGGPKMQTTDRTTGLYPAVRIAAFQADGAVEDARAWLEAPGVLPQNAAALRLSLKLSR